MMNKSRIAVFYKSGRGMELAEEEVPELKRGEILVRNAYTTLCRSDIRTYSGKRIEKSSTILGHAIAGRIVSFGPGSRTNDERGNPLLANDLITWAIFSSDQESELAKKGIPQKGKNLLKYGHEVFRAGHSLHGGLRDYIILRPNTPVVKVSEEIPLPVLALINCSVATVAAAILIAGEVRNKTVLGTGTGMLGLAACAMSKASDARRVVATDIDTARLETAKKFGADLCLDAGKGEWHHSLRIDSGPDQGVDVILEFSGANSAMEDTLQLLCIGGTAVWAGATFPQKALAVDAEQIVRRLITIRGRHNYSHIDLVRVSIDLNYPYLGAFSNN